MSLATTCPACGTCFRVVEDQLKISEGWVRCGHCQDVFNGLEGLFELEPGVRSQGSFSAPPPPQPAWTPEPPTADLRDAATVSTHAETNPRGDASGLPIVPDFQLTLPPPSGPVEPGWEAAHPAAPSASTEEAPTALVLIEPDAGNGSFGSIPQPIEPPTAADCTVVADPPTSFAAFLVDEAPANEPWGPTPQAQDALTAAAPDAVTGHTEAETASAPVPTVEPPAASLDEAPVTPDSAGDAAREPGPRVATTAAIEAETDAEDAPPATAALSANDADHTAALLPGFVRQAEQRARWERPGVRATLGAAALVLSLAIVAQVSWHWRDRLAYAWPAARPLLVQGCVELGCTLQAPRVIDALVVDNTVLTRPPGSPEGYKLSVTLHNRADHPVATPHLALDLNDAQGGVLVRKVLSPLDFHLAADQALAAQAEVSWTVEFRTSERRIAGYTVAAFYP